MAIEEPESLKWLILKYGFHRLKWVPKCDRPKLTLIQDFLKNPEKYENYWAKKHAKASRQLSLFDNL
jgi:hypothetical protein